MSESEMVDSSAYNTGNTLLDGGPAIKKMNTIAGANALTPANAGHNPLQTPQGFGGGATQTPMGTSVPKLNLGTEAMAHTTKNNPNATTGAHKRQLSDSSRGSIGRKERLRNALTGRSDGSEGGQDEPKELPDEELIDFIRLYDRSDPYSFKLIKDKRRKSLGSFDGEEDIPSNLRTGSIVEEIPRTQSVPYEGGSEEKLDLTGDPNQQQSASPAK